MSNVTIPPTGSGTATPVVSTDVVTADTSNVQNVQWVTVSGGVLARISNANPVPISDAGGSLTVDGTFWQTTQPVSAASLPLPTGASTETTLAAVNTKLGSALPLPTGAATQTTLAALLSALGTPLQSGGSVVASGTVTANLGTIAGVATAAKQPALGTAGTPSADVISIQGVSGGTAIPVTGGGTPTDVSGTKTFSVPDTLVLTGLNGMATLVVEVLSNTATMTASIQGTLDGTLWDNLNYTNSASNALSQTSISAGGATYIAQIAGYAQVRLNVGSISVSTVTVNMRASAGAANTRSVLISGGSLAANQSVNIAQVGGFAVGTGNGSAASGTQRVTISNDSTGVVGLNAGTNTIGATLPVSATPTLTQVASSATTVTILASNGARKAAVIVNDSTAILYLAFAATATTAAYTYKLAAGAILELPVAGRVLYTGLLSGIWSAANGNAVVTELA